MDETAAPAAVFPSASPSASPNWRRLDYLAHGNLRQRAAHALLTAGLWDALAAQCADMALVSTLAIGLDRTGSDLDIVCQHPDPAAFAATLAAFPNKERWQASDKGDNVWLLERTFPCVDNSAADKSVASWPVELYVTPAPIETLNGWRHLTLMAALLQRFGDAFYQEVLRLRLEQGLKGEAAMCRLLGLAGDPYAALLTLEGRNLAELSWQPPSRDNIHARNGMHASTDAAAMAPAAQPSSLVFPTISAPPVCPVSTESPNPTS